MELKLIYILLYNLFFLSLLRLLKDGYMIGFQFKVHRHESKIINKIAGKDLMRSTIEVQQPELW